MTNIIERLRKYKGPWLVPVEAADEIERLRGEGREDLMSTEPLDNFHAHEALDRAHVIICMIDDFLIKHPFVEQNEDILKLVEDAADRLAKAYQLIGQKY